MTPNDFGPIYRETDMSRFPVEPWNTASNLIFLLTFLYWSYRIYKNYKDYLVISISLPILFIGWVGGTIYHASRSHDLWLYMDFLPIYILGFVVAFNYWFKISKNFFKIFFLTVVPWTVVNLTINYLNLPQNIKASTGYFTIFTITAFPILRYAYKKRNPGNINLLYAVLSFVVAITMRIGDRSFPEIFIDIFPMGTHWVWHTVGGFCTFFMFKFVFEDRKSELTATIE